MDCGCATFSYGVMEWLRGVAFRNDPNVLDDCTVTITITPNAGRQPCVIANRLDAFVGRPVGKEPMREIYECKWCCGHFGDRTECVEHEPKCHDNPASRSCESCDHHDTVVADTGMVWNTCAVGVLTSPRWVENHATGCPQWSRESTPNKC